MGLLGKYTSYVGGGAATSAHKLLSKLFPAGPFATQVTQGDEKGAQAIVQATATAPVSNGIGGVQPSDGVQAGDLGMFPKGVDLSFAGRTLDPPNAPPDVASVAWKNPGDPANAYVPDVTSPGPGLTAGTDKNVDPQISVADVQQTSTTEDPSGQNLRNPVNDGPAVASASTIGKQQPLGDSGGNV